MLKVEFQQLDGSLWVEIAPSCLDWRVVGDQKMNFYLDLAGNPPLASSNFWEFENRSNLEVRVVLGISFMQSGSTSVGVMLWKVDNPMVCKTKTVPGDQVTETINEIFAELDVR